MRDQGRLKHPVEHSPEHVSLDGVDSQLSPLCLPFWEGWRDSLPKFYLSLRLCKQQHLLELRNKEAEVGVSSDYTKKELRNGMLMRSLGISCVWVTRRRQKVVVWLMEDNRKKFTVPPSASVLQMKRVLPSHLSPLRTLWSYFLLKFVCIWDSWSSS